MILTDDCYSEIIKNFEYDHQTLYNCLLVNHFLETYSSYNIKQAISFWHQYTQDISNTNLEHSTFEAIQSILLRKSKRIKKFDISVIKNSLTFPSITSSLFSSLELRECIFSFVVLNSQSTNVDNYINIISKRNKRIQSIRIIAYNDDIPTSCREPFLNLINNQIDIKKLELDYFITSSFKHLRREMLQVKSQSIRKLVLQGIRFNKNNLAKFMPNLEVLSIRCSFGNPLGEGQNSLKNLQKLELKDNDIELNKILLKAKCKALKFFIIIEKELSNEVKEELVFLLCLNYPNITTLCYVTDNLMFSFTLKKFQKLRQLQLGRLAYVAPYIAYDTPYIDPQYSNHDYLLTLNKFLPVSLKILNLLNIFDYSYINLNCFLQDFDIERVKLEVLILPFNIDLDFLSNLRTFIEKARFLRYIEIVRSENFNVENQKATPKKDSVQIANKIRKKNDLVQTAIQYNNKKEIIEETLNTMNAHLNAANNEKILDYKTEFEYMAQISARKEKLDKLKDYEGLEKELESLIEKIDSILTEWFELRIQSLNKFNYNVDMLNRKKETLKNALQTSKNNNKTRNAKVRSSLRILKNKLEINTKNQVNNNQIKQMNYQKIVDDKMDAILKDIKKKENTIENNPIMTEAFFKNKRQNELYMTLKKK
ncbi:17415_t:CDS:2 [Gigaspora margarita]|uniref:17415_t:CDS:1 n=1 Tax=Gigaspora margarita TaxID=4874 RepID=A0ABN7UJ43_GIGMA|nr:17415_t:CDS:2 [Gigaspora margarita]